jgi:hypothetical protein
MLSLLRLGINLFTKIRYLRIKVDLNLQKVIQRSINPTTPHKNNLEVRNLQDRARRYPLRMIKSLDPYRTRTTFRTRYLNPSRNSREVCQGLRTNSRADSKVIEDLQAIRRTNSKATEGLHKYRRSFSRLVESHQMNSQSPIK